MLRGYTVAVGMALFFFFGVTRFMLYTEKAPSAWWHYFFCGIVGLLTSYILIFITQYYTDYNYGPVKRIAKASDTGHGTNIIAGMSVGLESCALPSIIISISLLS